MDCLITPADRIFVAGHAAPSWIWKTTRP